MTTLSGESFTMQTLNGNNNPILGCYLNGRLWFFATLLGKTYCFSGGFVADDKGDIVRIFNILRKLRSMIEKQLK